MTANYPASILPPNATAVERAIDRASAAALARIPVYLIRWVKNPDSCPLALLPWLAWEYQVDTWNIDWSEQKKRDAIKRAYYIHCHRGTVAAVRRALVDSPFGTDIVEWFNQTPKGDPYTFRLNVYQNDLPVTEFDQQDLKLAVLRARNLRSWFSVHVFGRLQGISYAAGYAYATEYISPRLVPLQVLLSHYVLNLAPGDSQTVTVTVLPDYAEDKTFTVTTSDRSIATARIVNGAVVVKGVKRGDCTVTVTTSNGVSAVISVKVVAVMKFVTRIDSAARPLFFARMDEDFTIDYGDGVDSREYTFDAAGSVYGWVVPTRELEEGLEYTITVKNTETASFQRVLGGLSVTFNTVRELIYVTGIRDHLTSFASGATGLAKVHAGAFDDLPNVQSCRMLFYGCTSLAELPAGLFSNLTAVTDFSYVFYGCTSLATLPAGLFLNLTAVTDFSFAFYGCTALTALPDGLFRGLTAALYFISVFEKCTALTSIGTNTFSGCVSAVNFNNAFYGCTGLLNIGAGIFKGCVSAISFSGSFSRCTSLLALRGDMFADVPGGIFTSVFASCTSLTEIPVTLFRNCLEANHFGNAFSSCSGLLSVPAGLFAGLSKVTYFGMTFMACRSLKTVGAGVFAGCSLAATFSQVFYSCTSLETVADDIFSGCIAATTFSSAFYNCSSLLALPSFADCEKVTTFTYAFQGCDSLIRIEAGTFAGKTLVTTFAYAFANCKSLVSVGSGAFMGCSSLTSVGYAFSGCTALVTLAGDMFAGCSKVTAANFLFNQCRSLVELPPELFSDMVALTALGSTFQGCAGLIALPSGLLAGCVKLTSLTQTFADCTSLAVLPGDLLKHNTLLTSVGSTFSGCTALETLPALLFSWCPLITAFSGTFQNSGVVDIPESLFTGNLLATAFNQTFSGCKKLRAVPAGLFVANVNAAAFTYTFNGCLALETVGAGLLNSTAVTAVTYLFGECAALRTDLNTIFNLESYPAIVTTTALFRACGLLTGKGLVFISKLPNATAFYYTLFACNSLDDFDDLPGNWITNKL